MNLIEIKMSSSMFIMIISQFYYSMIIKKQLIKRSIYSGFAIFLASLFHHGGLADTSSASYHDKPVLPFDGVIKVTMKGRVKSTNQSC